MAGLSFERDSWTTPVDARRVEPNEDTNKVASEQVRELVGRLPKRDTKPLFVFDAGYVPERLQVELGECAAQILIRLNPTRVFYFDPETPEKRPVGHPFHHGERFDLKDLQTWNSSPMG